MGGVDVDAAERVGVTGRLGDGVPVDAAVCDVVAAEVLDADEEGDELPLTELVGLGRAEECRGIEEQRIQGWCWVSVANTHSAYSTAAHTRQYTHTSSSQWP